MRIIKRINNNVAVGRDSKGNEVVVFGRGVGFGAISYELTDLSQIEKTFYDVDKRYYTALADIPEKVFLLVSRECTAIKQQLKVKLNPNLPFILADHICFAVERCRKGMSIPMPYIYELEYQHAELIDISRRFIENVNSALGCSLGESEVTCVAMHLLNAMESDSNSNAVVHSTEEDLNRHIDEIAGIVERHFGFVLDRKGFHFLRFKNHLAYFFRRREYGEVYSGGNEELFNDMKLRYPQAFECVQLIDEYLSQQFGEHCPDEEKLYLMAHIIQLYTKQGL